MVLAQAVFVLLFGELMWTRQRFSYVLWSRPLNLEEKKDWREHEHMGLDNGLRAEDSPVPLNSQHRPLCLETHTRPCALENTACWSQSLLASCCMELGCWWPWVPQVLQTQPQLLCLGTASCTSGSIAHMGLHSAPLIIFPSGPPSRHKMLTSGLQWVRTVSNYAGWKKDAHLAKQLYFYMALWKQWWWWLLRPQLVRTVKCKQTERHFQDVFEQYKSLLVSLL